MTTAFVIIDVQNAIVQGVVPPERQPALDAALDAVASRLGALKTQAEAAGIPVILVQHADQDLIPGTAGWDLRGEIAPRGGNIVIQKTSCDSFFETGLHDQLRALSADHLVIGGCQTQYCVDTAVRRAVSLGFDVTLIGDGHTTVDWGALGFEQIIAHHNATLDGFSAGSHGVRVRSAADIRFS